MPNEFPHFLLPGDRGNRDVFGHLIAKDNNKNKMVCSGEGINLLLPEKMVSHDNRFKYELARKDIFTPYCMLKEQLQQPVTCFSL